MEYLSVVGLVGLIGAFFTNAVSTGTVVLAALLSIATLVGVVYGAKWKAHAEAAGATIELWEKNADGYKEQVEILTGQNDRLAANNADYRERIAKLELMPDLTSMVEAQRAHEGRAQERHDATLGVLVAIKTTLEGGTT